jgi:hypothetical protein
MLNMLSQAKFTIAMVVGIVELRGRKEKV